MNQWLSGKVLFKYCSRHGFESSRALKLSAATWPFCVALSLSVDWHKRFYIAVQPVFLHFFSQKLASHNLSLTKIFQLQLFWSIWSRARGWDLPTCVGFITSLHGQWLLLMYWLLAFWLFPEMLQIQKNCGPDKRHFKFPMITLISPNLWRWLRP